MHDVSLDRLRPFAEVARLRSFTAAARVLGISKVAVSQQVRRLESELGAQLLVRTTRTIALTEAGKDLYESASAVLSRVSEVVHRLKHRAVETGGRLRVTAPQDLAPLLAKAAADLMARSADLEIEIAANDAVVNLIETGFDLAIRVGWLRDSRLHAVLLKRTLPLLLASPDYLAAVGTPATPEDLTRLRWVAQSPVGLSGWRFSNGSRSVRVSPRAATLTNSTLVVKALLLNGTGVGILPQHVVMPELQGGSLVSALPGWRLPDAGIFAVHPYAPRYAPSKVREFIAAIRSALLVPARPAPARSGTRAAPPYPPPAGTR